MQLPHDQSVRQPLLNDLRTKDHRSYGAADGHSLHQSPRNGPYGDNRAAVARYHDASTKIDGNKGWYNDQASQNLHGRHMSENNRLPTHSYRIIRGRVNKPRGERYGSSRYGTVPYDRKSNLTWREKSKSNQEIKIGSPVHVKTRRDIHRAVFPYEQPSNSTRDLVIQDQDFPPSHRTEEEERSGGERSKKRLASAIVSPPFNLPSREQNVTIRTSSLARSLTYSPTQAQEDMLGNEQIIDALDGMELFDTVGDGAMECDVQNDDLLGEDLMVLEDNVQASTFACSDITATSSKSTRTRGKLDAPLGIQNKKSENLRRGSPRPRSAMSTKQFLLREAEKSRRRCHSQKKAHAKTTKDEVLMGSKNPSKHH